MTFFSCNKTLSHMKKNLFLVLFIIFNFNVYSEEVASLDSVYPDLIHPKFDVLKSSSDKSDLDVILPFISSVKSQGKRGTCSIFASVAELEALLSIKNNIRNGNHPDISEEWLQYLQMSNKKSNDEGSTSFFNSQILLKFGFVKENNLPYDPRDWSLMDERSAEKNYCKKTLSANNRIFTPKDLFEKCLFAHENPILIHLSEEELGDNHPSFSDLISYSQKNLKGNIIDNGEEIRLKSVSQIRSLLSNGIPVILGLDFFYGAWNHSKAKEYGIGRNMELWDRGIVTYPEKNSVDYRESRKHEAGHAVLIIGYDDNIIVTNTYKTITGETVTKKYRGVYFLKNSWGTKGFGSNFVYDGKRYPGFGVITYDYAHQYGGFTKLPINL